MKWLRLELYAPMASFGGPAIDAIGRTNDAPGRSMLTGLIANALGWEHDERDRLQLLQDKLAYAAVREDDPDRSRLTDYQTAQLTKDDKAWTTTGKPAVRKSNAATFSGAHQRWRDYHSDIRVTVVMTLLPAQGNPSLDDIAEALQRPARPLFIGRACCIPTRPVFAGTLTAPDMRAALTAVAEDIGGTVTVYYPAADTVSPVEGHRLVGVTDDRDWRSGLHGGERLIYTGRLEGGRT